tara:strand:+ start:15270 stop:16319 length:1050 start_codon:yes stop_codon:yes gene_type:complete
MAKFYSIKISGIKKLTEEAVEISFDIPENLTQVFSYKSGQYITIESVIKNESIRRAYSICSSMHENKLSIGVKKVKNGKMSTWLNEIVKVGDIVDVMPPNGNFQINSSIKNQSLGLCAGSGITPILSILKDTLHTKEDSTFTLMYGNRSPESEMFVEELVALKEKYSSRLQIIKFYSDLNIEEHFFGNIDENNLSEIFANKQELLNLDNFLICGPGNMIDNLNNFLIQKDITKDKIIFERFSSSDVDAEVSNVENLSCDYTFIIDDEEYEITEHNNKDSVLDIALKNDLDAPYSCKGAVCSTCKAKLISGEVEMSKNFSLSESEIKEGYILACVSHHKTKNVTIDFDVF